MKILLSILAVCCLLGGGLVGYIYLTKPAETEQTSQFSAAKKAAIAARADSERQEMQTETQSTNDLMSAEDAARLADEKAAQAASQ